MVSPVAYILIPAALVLFFRGRRALLWATLLLVPFFGVGVVDLGVTSIAGFQLFGVLFIARCMVDDIWSTTGGLKPSRANAVAAFFLFLCFASLSMAVLNAGAVEVYTETKGRWIEVVRNSVPLRLSVFNFTQILYPIFGVLLFHFVVRELRSLSDLRKAINILVWGALAIAVMSIGSGVLYTTGQGELYRQILGLFSIGPFGDKGPQSASFGRFFRMYTLAGEPGFTALTLLVGTGLVGGSVLQKGISPVRWPIAKFSVILVALLLNGSTTAYFGAVVFITWVPIVLWYTGETSLSSVLRPLVYVFGGVVLLGGLASTVQVSGAPFHEWLINYHLAKFQGEAGSGQIRAYVAWYSLREVFLTSPILGVGYGSHLSLSLVTFLLSNVGLLGFGAFLAFFYTVLRNTKRTVQNARGPLRGMAFIGALTLPPFLATLFVAKATSGMNMGLTWTIIALAEATYQVYRRDQTHSTAQV
ncbi:hypothetical protein GGP81_001905 [Salinibacter ruber]|uniref:hypothetical protein n=1 Tax=Salinibacter ruber TaxID=146919 RepID=UPI0021690659|nr:hypothetical protein [Salinibacter ruber]MCS3955380.1 hypothetical protein [Salinibacter ruber]